MAAKNRPMFCLSAMSSILRDANLQPQDRARVDTSISVLVDLTGACERIFKSPVPLVYTRHTARFLTVFTLLLPFGLWEPMGKSWNHWATVPATDVIAFFLFGIEEIGIQIEEPFSILPIEAFCNGAISATAEEMLTAQRARSFATDSAHLEASPPTAAPALAPVSASVPMAASTPVSTGAPEYAQRVDAMTLTEQAQELERVLASPTLTAAERETLQGHLQQMQAAIRNGK